MYFPREGLPLLVFFLHLRGICLGGGDPGDWKLLGVENI